MKQRILLVCILIVLAIPPIFTVSNSASIPRSYPDISHSTTLEVLPYRYGQTLQVDTATGKDQEQFRVECGPCKTNLQMSSLPEHKTKQNVLESLMVINAGEFTLARLYLLTPTMEAKRDCSKEILQGQVIRSGETLVIDLTRWLYLHSFLEKQTHEILSVEAYDEDGVPTLPILVARL